MLNDLRLGDLQECAKIIGVAHTGTRAEVQARLSELIDTFRGAYWS